MSAHWCPPCKGLLPTLKRFYEEVNSMELDNGKNEDDVSISNNKNFEIVYVSFDNSID